MKRLRDQIDEESKDSDHGRIIKFIKAVEHEETEEILDSPPPPEPKPKFIPWPLRTGTHNQNTEES